MSWKQRLQRPRRKFLIGWAALGLSLALTSCAVQETAGQPSPIVIQLSHAQTMNDSSFYHRFATEFADRVGEYTDHSVEIEVVGGGQLGSERVVVEGLQLGTVDSAIVGSFILGNFEPDLRVFDLPFLFEEYDSAERVLRSEAMTAIEQSLAERQIVALSWGQGGFRNIMSTRGPVHDSADLSGLKIRLPENNTYMRAFSQLGASPTPMAFSEVFTGLQQGTIDAVENPTQAIYDQRYYEAADQLSLTRHFFSPAPLLFSPDVWDSLSAEQQDEVNRAAAEAADAEWDYVVESEDEYLELLREESIEVTENPDRNELRQAALPVYEDFRESYGHDLLDRILEEAGEDHVNLR